MQGPDRSPDPDRVRIRHMVDAGRGALESVGGKTLKDLLSDRILRNSVVRDIEVLGEAAARVSRRFRSRHPEVEWRGIVGMRNRLIHAYFDVDAERVWKTLHEEVPPLLDLLDAILAAED